MERKKAIVTGGSTGIGVAIIQALIERDYEVINLSRRAAGLTSPRLRSIEVDLSDPLATVQVAQELSRTDSVTTIVHNAGAIREKRLEDVTLEDLDTLAHLHLTTPIALVQANLAAMRAAAFGRIVLVSSRAIVGLAKRTAYTATKAGMLGLARTWTLELAPAGITTNVVAPGPIEETEMFETNTPKGSSQRSSLVQAIPVRRLGRPDDVARAVCFFTDPAASFVTGQTLYVCGGLSVGTLAV